MIYTSSFGLRVSVCSIVVVAFMLLRIIENMKYCRCSVDHTVITLRPVDEDDNTYINAVSVNVRFLGSVSQCAHARS